MNRFISLSVWGLVLTELVVFLLSLIRYLTGIGGGFDPNLFVGIALLAFLGFSIAAFISFIIVLIHTLRRRDIEIPKAVCVVSLLLWIPATIASSSIGV